MANEICHHNATKSKSMFFCLAFIMRNRLRRFRRVCIYLYFCFKETKFLFESSFASFLSRKEGILFSRQYTFGNWMSFFPNLTAVNRKFFRRVHKNLYSCFAFLNFYYNVFSYNNVLPRFSSQR